MSSPSTQPAPRTAHSRDTVSTFTTADHDPARAGDAIAHDRARALLGQIMGYVAVTVGFAALADTSGERVAAASSPMRQRYGKRSAPADACSSSLAGVWIGPSVMLAYTHAKRN